MKYEVVRDRHVYTKVTDKGVNVEIVRLLNEQVVLDTILHAGPISRAEIARRTKLSKPTVSDIVMLLEESGLVHRIHGVAPRHEGRPGIKYVTNSNAGFIIGTDLGGTKVTSCIADLYGEILYEITERTRGESWDQLLGQISRQYTALFAQSGVDKRKVKVISFGVPGIYDAVSDQVYRAANVPALDSIHIKNELASFIDVAFAIENDANLAAVGELWKGSGSGIDNFAAITIGTGIGMGIVLGGVLYRGSHGAAGEIDYFPVDNEYSLSVHGPLESSVAGPAIFSRLASMGLRVSTLEEAFALANSGDWRAITVLNAVIQKIARAIVGIVCILDIDMVILGGGVGSNSMLAEVVSLEVGRMHPRPPRIVASVLGNRAPLYGAIAIGLSKAREVLLSEARGGV